jgi:hypothetical protein
MGKNSMPAYLIMWNPLNRDGSVSKAERQRIVRNKVAAKSLVGGLKQPADTWCPGGTCVVGPENKELISRGANIGIFKIENAYDLLPEDVPPGWKPSKEPK